MIDVSIAIDHFATTVAHKTRAPGTYDGVGNSVPGTEASNDISATIQPIRGRELLDLPEGVRNEATKLFWSRTKIKNDDMIVEDGLSYRVLHVWDRKIGGFARAALGLIK